MREEFFVRREVVLAVIDEVIVCRRRPADVVKSRENPKNIPQFG
jgi:hypothetical protein